MVKFLGCALGSIVVVASIGHVVCSSHSGFAFQDLHEARSRLEAAGFHCTADRADGQLVGGFLVSREEASWVDASALCKTGTMGPAWQGKVWVGLHTQSFEQSTHPDDTLLREWGEVVAYGDEELLSAVENAMEQGK